MHVVFYERPTDKMLDPATGKMQWNFAIVTQERDSKRTLRTKRKEERRRSRVTNERKWTGESRAYFAQLVNAALEEAGVKRRIDPRRYTDMGIDEKPIPRMEPKAYQKEKQGEPTAAGDRTITAQWDRELKRISALYDPSSRQRRRRQIQRHCRPLQDKAPHQHRRGRKDLRRLGEAVVDKRGALAERAASSSTSPRSGRG